MMPASDRSSVLAPTQPLPDYADVGLRLQAFARFLANNDIPVDTGTLVDAHQLASLGYLQDSVRWRDALRGCFCQCRAHWQAFDALFDAFWFARRLEAGDEDTASDGDSRVVRAGSQRLLGFGGSSEKLTALETVIGAGDFKALSLADFRFVFDPAEMAVIEQLVRDLARRARRRHVRRQRLSTKGSRTDLRHSIRRQLRQGSGADLIYRHPRKRLPALVLLLDISQSMDVYTRLFLRFTRELLRVFDRSEAFTFNTDLTPLARGSRRLQEADLERALNHRSTGWLGGTRIAGSLATFNAEHLRRVVDTRSTVVIFSDGCDTGKPAAVAREVAVIQRRAGRLLWVNPLLGRFEPGEADQHMDPVLPYVDAYHSAHNLEALLTLERVLLGST